MLLLGFALRLGAVPSARSASAASIVPAQVRKSFAVTSRPVISLQVRVHVVRLHDLPPAVVVEVLEELLAAQLLTALHDARDAAVGHGHRVLDAALAAKLEPQLAPSTATWRRRSVVSPKDLFAFAYSSDADANERRSSSQTTVAMTLSRGSPGARCRDSTRSRIFQSTSLSSNIRSNFVPSRCCRKPRMVAILLATTRVARRDLQMPVLVRADPDVGPRRRNHERAEAPQHLARANYAAVGINVSEAAAVPLPANAGHRIGHVAKSRRFRGADVFL